MAGFGLCFDRVPFPVRQGCLAGKPKSQRAALARFIQARRDNLKSASVERNSHDKNGYRGTVRQWFV